MLSFYYKFITTIFMRHKINSGECVNAKYISVLVLLFFIIFRYYVWMFNIK